MDYNLYNEYRRGFAHKCSERLSDSVLLVTESDEIFYYLDAEDASARLANRLVKLGLQPGDRVTVQVEKSPQALWLYLACLRAGLVFHPLNTAYLRGELAYFLENAAPALVVCDGHNEELMAELVAECSIPHLLVLNADGSGSLTEDITTESTEFETVSRRADDMAALLYSSGTTGRPKGIVLTHANLGSNSSTLIDSWGFSETDRLLHALPIFHVHGLFVALGCVLMSGASMRWLQAFKVDAAIKYLPEVTVMMGVPTFYTRLLQSELLTPLLTKNMRLFISGSAPLLAETFREFNERTGHFILERYGMSETSMNTSNPLLGERKAGTVGPPLPGVEVRIVNEINQVLPEGEIGNLQVRGPNVFSGYWKLPDKTAEEFTTDGFFNTGDKGCIDADGYVAIVGRAKDMVITGGLNVYPREVELLIDDLPGVRESAVIGVPHADFGEAVVAVVVQEPGAGLTEHAVISAMTSNLAKFKVPKKVVFVDELPRNTMAKVQKNLLREAYEAILQE